MRKIFVGLAALLFLAVIAQVYFAAEAAFNGGSFEVHRTIGTWVIPGLSVVSTAIAMIARVPRRLVMMSILPAVLCGVQVLIGVIIDGLGGNTAAGLIFGLHGVIALAIWATVHDVFMEAMPLAGGAKESTRDAQSTTSSAS